MISVLHVTKRYGVVEALSGVTLEIHAGERVAFIGSNGSGKTTLLRSILGLLHFEGKITIMGANVLREPEVALRTVAYVPQIAPPLDASVRDVVRACAALRNTDDDATWACAKRLGLSPDACGSKRFRDLSGGMKQKLLAAMALAAATPILVCDEPTANLDRDARAAFFEQLAERPATGIVILCSHRVEEVRSFVRRTVELGDGRIIGDTSAGEPSEQDAQAETKAPRLASARRLYRVPS